MSRRTLPFLWRLPAYSTHIFHIKKCKYKHEQLYDTVNTVYECLYLVVYTYILRRMLHFGHTDGIQRMSLRLSMAIREG